MQKSQQQTKASRIYFNFVVLYGSGDFPPEFNFCPLAVEHGYSNSLHSGEFGVETAGSRLPWNEAVLYLAGNAETFQIFA